MVQIMVALEALKLFQPLGLCLLLFERLLRLLRLRYNSLEIVNRFVSDALRTILPDKELLEL